jgi:hypothetical protein
LIRVIVPRAKGINSIQKGPPVSGGGHSLGAGTFNHATATSGVKVAQHPQGLTLAPARGGGARWWVGGGSLSSVLLGMARGPQRDAIGGRASGGRRGRRAQSHCYLDHTATVVAIVVARF